METLNVKFVGMFKMKQEDGSWKTFANYAVTSDSKQFVQDARDRGKEDSKIFFDESNPKQFVGKARFVTDRFIGDEAIITRKVVEDGRAFYNPDNTEAMLAELDYNAAPEYMKSHLAAEEAKAKIAERKLIAQALRARKAGTPVAQTEPVKEENLNSPF